MSFEASLPGNHPSREAHEKDELRDLEQQFADLERRLASGEVGRSAHKFLLTFAYDKLLQVEAKNMLPSDLAAAYHARAERMNGQLYEDAA